MLQGPRDIGTAKVVLHQDAPRLRACCRQAGSYPDRDMSIGNEKSASRQETKH